METDREVLGIDIGRVIIDGDTDASIFGENFLETASVPQSVEMISRLVRERFHERTHLISKSGERVQMRTKQWLDHRGFYQQTHVSPERVHFCLKRFEKVGICQRFGVTHFIDDRLEILSYLVGIVPHLFLFRPNPAEVEHFVRALPSVQRVESWEEIGAHLLS